MIDMEHLLSSVLNNTDICKIINIIVNDIDSFTYCSRFNYPCIFSKATVELKLAGYDYCSKLDKLVLYRISSLFKKR
jgi:hypothetical protein